MRLDLHVHTVASDGTWTPEEVVEGAVSGRLDAISVTDHDTTASVESAREAAQGRNLLVIPGVELSSTWEGREIHILGYFIDPASPAIIEHQARATSLRNARMDGMVGRLRAQGIDVNMGAVRAVAGGDDAILARPHLARVLVSAGHVATLAEAFDRFIGDRHPAFLPTALQDPVEAVDVVRAAGGVAVWAHPPADAIPELLPILVRGGLRGIEVYRPTSSAGHVERLLSVALSQGLVASGGSDWHDPERNGPLGAFFVTSDDVGGLLDEGEI
jgi:predicted metal-dependent phosphoesterase TrpH